MSDYQPLTLHPVLFSSGVPDNYDVEGLPEGQTANIAFSRRRSVEVWKVRRNGRGYYKGNYQTAEEALAALQAQIDFENRQP